MCVCVWLSFFVQPQCCHPAPASSTSPALEPWASTTAAGTSGVKLGCFVASCMRKNQRPLGFTPRLAHGGARMRIGSMRPKLSRVPHNSCRFVYFICFFELSTGVNAPITSYNWDWCLLHPFDGSRDGFSCWWYCQAVLVVSSTSKVPQRRSPRNISRRNTRQIYNLYNMLCTIGSAWEFVPIVGHEAIFSVRRLLKPPKNGKPIIAITHMTKNTKMDYHAQPFGENTYRDWRYYSKRRRKLRVESNNWNHWMIMPSALSDQFPSCSCIWTSMFNSVCRFWCPSSIF